jgi:ATP-binding cassette, subfamily B, bacterial
VTGIISKIDTSNLPAKWRSDVLSQLGSGEQLVAFFEPDLNARLDFADGLVALTDRQVLAIEGDSRDSETPASGANGKNWRSWPIKQISELRIRESAGLGALDFIGPTALEATWQYTMAQAAPAPQFVQAFRELSNNDQSKHAKAKAAVLAPSICPSCGAKIEPPQTVCESCAPSAAPPPVRSLWRLGRFARPRAGMVFLGFALTLASTAAGLVPPYLTIPLLNNVLIPRQNGLPVDFSVVPWYLVALFGAALLAWMLSWSKTYVLSRVSEQISCDLRIQTYAHLQRLSLEFFGGKRTGDLISRVGSDTDRICTFLSVNLLDFCTDVLMIVMTAIVLFTIDPMMALVTLLPFPLIAWMAQKVRIRLRHGFARGRAAWAEMVNVLADTIPGIRVVKAFAQEKREIERFSRRNQHVFDANNRVNVLWSFFGPTVTLLTDCGMLVIWGYGAWRVLNRSTMAYWSGSLRS